MLVTAKGILVIIFFNLSCLHWYWAFGGKWGLEYVIPTKTTIEKAIKPNPLATILVAIALLLIAYIYLLLIFSIHVNIFPTWVIKYGIWIVPSVFLLRVLGDFKYVGLFKKIKKTTFGINDTKYFIPLCAIIATLGFIIALN
ncbi:DUF3995 domain-containing protein [uncultured Maribacter sp.]|uniref:DUF3995 domain-containing protein n=1 Tax=uncultured Maribacter sp. TaxID=431308 RepID=UPI002622D9BA|nr:DUF3995 domain-containing protein [uncultured Maribacter sp.]